MILQTAYGNLDNKGHVLLLTYSTPQHPGPVLLLSSCIVYLNAADYCTSTTWKLVVALHDSPGCTVMLLLVMAFSTHTKFS